MILILSDKNDVHADKVAAILDKKNEKYIRFNLDLESLKRTKVTFKNGSWLISFEDKSFFTQDISSVWGRKTYVELLLEEMEDNTPDFKIWKGEWNKTLLGIYSSLDKRLWLNFYRNAYFAENKYLQAKVALELGFNVPQFISSNDLSILKLFFASHSDSEVVLKLMNQDFYKTTEGEFKGIYVSKVTERDLLKFKDFGENPITLQEYIQKKYEVRYTVVGQEHFVCKIESQKSEISKVDWRRYDLPNTPHSKIEAPDHIKEQVNKFMTYFDLNYGAFDFIVSLDEKWFFLELNSMGQYLWIEDLAGLPISEEIANWLIFNNKQNSKNYESFCL